MARHLALLVALSLVVGLAPVGAFAAEGSSVSDALPAAGEVLPGEPVDGAEDGDGFDVPEDPDGDDLDGDEVDGEVWTRFSREWTNEDGTRTLEISPQPVFFEDEEGVWGPQDLTLVASEDGSRLVPRAAPAEAARLVRSTEPGAPTLEVGRGGNRVEVSHPQTGEVSRGRRADPNAVRYGKALSSGRDLLVEATVDGFKESVVVDDRSAGRSYLTEFALPAGWKARDGGPGVEFVDGDGELVAVFGGGIAFDGHVGPVGLGAETEVRSRLVRQTGRVATVESSVDAGWFNDPVRVFPITIDPTWSWRLTGGDSSGAGPCATNGNHFDQCDVYVNSDAPEGKYYLQSELRVGSPGQKDAENPSLNNITRTFLKFPTDSYGTTSSRYPVLSATISMHAYFASSTENHRYDLYGAATHPTRDTRWASHPARDANGLVASRTLPGTGSISFTVASLAQRWFNGEANRGVRIEAAAERTTTTFRRFHSGDTGLSTAPLLTINFTRNADVPVLESPTADRFTRTIPHLYATYRDPDGDAGRVYFQLRRKGTSTVIAQDWSAQIASGSEASFALPADLTDGAYEWRAKARDRHAHAIGTTTYDSSYTPWRTFILDRVAPPAPDVSSATHPSQTTWYSSTAPSLSWTAPADTSGINGYSWILDQNSSTLPNTSSNGNVTSTAYTGIGHGEWWFHIRARDGAGNWSADATRRRIRIDTSAPSTPTITSTSHPDPDDWYASRSVTAAWTASTDTGSGIAGYATVLDTDPTTIPTGTTSTSRTFSTTVTNDGVYHLHVRPRDNAGNWGTTARHRIRIGAPTVASPSEGEVTGKWFDLDAQGLATQTGVTYEYRRDTDGSWEAVPAAAVTRHDGGAVSWPVPLAGGSHTGLRWNVPATAAGFSDGPLWVRASFTGGGGGATPAVLVHLDRTSAAAASEQVGPGTVNLLTGNYTMTAFDASVGAGYSDLTLVRSHNSRKPDDGGPDGPFGPQWTASLPVLSALSAWSRLKVGDGFVEVTGSDGDVVRFTRQPGGTHAPELGAEHLTLTASSPGPTPAGFTLRDLDLNTTTFTREDGTDRYQVSSVEQAASNSTTTYHTDAAGRIHRVIAPVAAGVDAATPAGQRCVVRVAGCRELRLVYATATTASGDQFGDHVGRVSAVELRWHDGSPRSVVLAAYRYDAQGRLREVRDERVSPALVTAYSYDSDGRVTQLTPPGEAPWQLTYRTEQAEAGRLTSVSRSDPDGAATTTLSYDVPLSGTGAPHQMGPADMAAWGQTRAPIDATAIHPPTTGTDLSKATVHYLGRHGNQTNLADPGGGITTTEHDEHSNVTRELTAANRARALDAPAGQRAAVAERLSTTYTYSADGVDLLSETGPEHEVVLPDGEQVAARRHIAYRYDEGYTGDPEHAPRLATTVTVGALVDGREGLQDPRTTRTDYDWTLRKPTATIIDPDGLNIVRTTLYDPATGAVTEIRMPSDPAGTNAGTTRHLHYTAGTNPTDPDCGDKPQWAGLLCKTAPAAQPTVEAGRPAIPTIHYQTYDPYQQPTTIAEARPGHTDERVTTISRDPAGRETNRQITATDGHPVPPTTTTYHAQSGRLTTTSDGTHTITRTYDTVGRLATYTDADGNTATYTYDHRDRITTLHDGKATQTTTYDPITGHVTRLEDEHAGTFTGTYDPDGQIATQTLPTGLRATTTYNPDGQPVSLTYTQPQPCPATGCVWLDYQALPNIHGQWAHHTSLDSHQTYTYDNAARLIRTRDTQPDGCTARTYTLDVNTNRTAKTTHPPAPDGTCQITTGTTETDTYDEADRATTSGYTYDSFGRTLTIPADRAGGTALSAAYHADDLVRSLDQDGTTRHFDLDPARRLRMVNTVGDGITTHHYSADTDSPAWIQTGNTWTRNIRGIDGLFAAMRKNTGETGYHLTDLHGDITATTSTDLSEGLISTHDTDEFGVPRASATGYYHLGVHQRHTVLETGMILMGVRVYNPHSGRFLQTDPVPGGSDNRYEYARHDPINLYDLSGLAASAVAAPLIFVPGVGWGVAVAAGLVIAGGAIYHYAKGKPSAKKAKNATAGSKFYPSRKSAVRAAQEAARRHPRASYRGQHGNTKHVHVEYRNAKGKIIHVQHYRWR